jgi:hypothetical protein
MAVAWVSCLLGVGWCAAAHAEVTAPCGACQAGVAGKHGTEINWVASPQEAAKQAAADGKLVLLMQISGNFAREEFT